MKTLLLGATGRTGKLVLQELLKNKHEVHCLGRNISRIAVSDRLILLEGDPSNSEDLLGAIRGCNNVISVLNISRTSDFPWAKLRTPKKYLSDVMGNLIPICEKENVKRIVACSAWGVAETRKDLPFWFKWVIDFSNVGIAYQDHERQEKILTASHLDWTIVRPTGLTNSKRKQTINESFEGDANLFISRASVAHYLVSSLSDTRLIRKKVVISKN